MPRKKRKIGFYYLCLINEDLNLNESFKNVINYINGLDKTHKNFSLGNNKFCILDSVVFYQNDNQTNVIFKSATHSYRPNLIHKETVDERESPKDIAEGEIEKTHLVTNFVNNDLILLLEKHLHGISISQFVRYLNHYGAQLDEPIQFKFETVVKDNFLEEINNLSRVTCADIYVDKQMLGGEALNYSDNLNEVKHEVILSVKSKKMESIADFARDTFAFLNGGNNSVRRIRLVGRNMDNNEVIINTDFIERQEYISPEINEITGEPVTHEVFNEMNLAIQNF
ncbi:hypothetical protein [Flavobacterium pectinovorum]|uniref:DUF4747 family protein n=1 Tax=Flavobacterium pectinovorum TaxID=29533 RepID=A0A502F562_9FLAO|nr:hypothetical protein [Flavobacterium pectinovorum]TPG44562.1 hypothetical protein EAH81_03550 [Flavobacterium pectinovorum]